MRSIKICKECKRNLPSNTDFYFKKKDTSDGFANKCKECMGNKFTDKLSKQPKDGYKFCKKCSRELPCSISYFPQDNSCKGGMRNVCRECGKDGKFFNDDYKPKNVWNRNELNLFIERYPHYTNKELIEIFYPDESEKSIVDRAYRLKVVKSKETTERRYLLHSEKMSGIDSPLYGIVRSEETKNKLSSSLKGKFLGENNYWYGMKRSIDQRLYLSKIKKKAGQWKGEKNPRHINPLNGAKNGNWQGGLTEIYAYLRNSLSAWKQASMKNCNYKCVITGEDFDVIHHLINFRTIVNETFENLQLDIKNKLSDYSDEELNLIQNECVNLHMKLYGVCLKEELHILFHKKYGYSNNTIEQFYEFEKLYETNSLVFDEMVI